MKGRSPSQRRLSTISCLTLRGKEHPNGHLHTRVTRPLLHRRGPREVWFRRRTYRVKPSANVHLSVGLPAVVPCSGRICGFRVPFENRELRIAALNHKPVNRIAGYCPADFTSEFLKRCHKFPIVRKAPGHIVTRPSRSRRVEGTDVNSPPLRGSNRVTAQRPLKRATRRAGARGPSPLRGTTQRQ